MALCVACSGSASDGEVEQGELGEASNQEVPGATADGAVEDTSVESELAPLCRDAVDGLLSRPEAVACEVGCGASVPMPVFEDPPVVGTHECLDHADCQAGAGGHCRVNHRSGFYYPNRCYYDECSTDADCGTDAICVCGNGEWSSRNACVSSTCRVDADCGPGQTCADAVAYAGSCRSSGSPEFHCTSDADECQVDADCTDQEQPLESVGCAWDSEQSRRLCRAFDPCGL